MSEAGVDRFESAFHHTRRERDALLESALVSVALPAKAIARAALSAMKRIAPQASLLVDASSAFDPRVLGTIETYANAVLHAQRRTEKSGPDELEPTYRRALDLRTRLTDEAERLARQGHLHVSIVADVDSERGYAVVAHHLLTIARRLAEAWTVIEPHTELLLEDVREGSLVGQRLLVLQRRFEQIDQKVHGARLDLRRALTLLVGEYDALRAELTDLARTTGATLPTLTALPKIDSAIPNGPTSLPPSTKPVPTPPPEPARAEGYKKLNDPETTRTPRVANDNETPNETWKKCA